jgi:uncharacterized membrane protein YphA (DoxX/SURF4 family)
MLTLMFQAYAGLFFLFSGYHKLFNKERHASLVETLQADKVPLIKINQWFVPSVEFFGGLGLLTNLHPALVILASLGLTCICLVACLVDGSKRVAAWKPIDFADKIDDYLYLPELSLVLMLVFIIISKASILLA